MADNKELSERQGRKVLLQGCIDKIDIVYTELQGGESKNVVSEDCDTKQIWERIVSSSTVLSHECTKLSMALNKPPYPSQSALEDFIHSLETAILSLVSAFYSLPKLKGLTLRKNTHKTVVSILEAVHEFITSLQDQESGESSRLHNTGKVWELCEKINRLPHNNKDAVIRAVKSELGLVEDAVEELQEEIKSHMENLEEGNNSEAWSNQDREILPSCVGLVKTTKSVMRKVTAALDTGGSCETEENIAQLDDIMECVKQISPQLDEFVIATYPPLRKGRLEEEMTKLCCELHRMISMCAKMHFISESDGSWIKFLSEATDHNKNKISQMLHDSASIPQ